MLQSARSLNKLLMTAALAAGVASLASSANSSLQIPLASSAGGSFSCVDNAACDQNAAIGILELENGSVGGFNYFGTASVANMGNTNLLTLSSLNVTNTNAGTGTLMITVGANNFTGPVDSI